MNLNSIQDIKDILRSKIFVFESTISYVFEDDAFAKLDGDMRLLIRRDNIAWQSIKAKYPYAIHQSAGGFTFLTFGNELHPLENEFIINIEESNGTYILSLLFLKDGSTHLRLISD